MNNNYKTTVSNKKTSRATCREYYAYRLQVRDSKDSDTIDQDVLLYGAKLFKQYLCDMYVKIETERLDYLYHNQSMLKAELYRGLADAISSNDTKGAGKHIILPSTHINSPRYYLQCYADAMAIVRKYGKPDLFITFTCNPSKIKSLKVTLFREILIHNLFRLAGNKRKH